MKKYFTNLLLCLQSIAKGFADNTNKQNEILEKLSSKTNDLWTAVYTSSWTISWCDVIGDNLVEDSRDTWVMIDRKKAVKIVTIDWKAEKVETFTRQSSLTKEEKEHYKKYWIVLVISK